MSVRLDNTPGTAGKQTTSDQSEQLPSVPRRGFLQRLAAVIAGGTALSFLHQQADAGSKSVAPTSAPGKTAGTLGSSPYIGEIQLFAGNFAPTGWAFCNGQLLSIAANTALFSILGTTYGGNGTTNFALPNLQGLAPLGADSLNYYLGTTGGEAKHALNAEEIPSHNHSINVVTANGTTCKPSLGYHAVNAEGSQQYSNSAGAAMSSSAVAGAGRNQSHNNMQPYLGVSFIVALWGVFPPRP